tara:strand:- start:16203 stop:16475 length:273 start_codon:yes stop_codon:yes gene_type:complete
MRDMGVDRRSVLLGMIGLEAIVTDKCNFYGLEDKVAVVVLELHHLGVVVATVEDGRDAKEHGLLHREQRHHDLRHKSRVAVGGFLRTGTG